MGRRRGMMFWLGVFGAGLTVLVAVGAIVGALLPRDHVARVTIRLASPPERIWALVSDVAGAATWRRDVTAVVMLPATGGPPRFVETSKSGRVTFELVDQQPPRRQVVRVVDDDQPFGGIWTWSIEPEGDGTRVTLTEAGFVKNPLFRLMAKLVFSPTTSLRSYLAALSAALGETAAPEVVPVETPTR